MNVISFRRVPAGFRNTLSTGWYSRSPVMGEAVATKSPLRIPDIGLSPSGVRIGVSPVKQREPAATSTSRISLSLSLARTRRCPAFHFTGSPGVSVPLLAFLGAMSTVVSPSLTAWYSSGVSPALFAGVTRFLGGGGVWPGFSRSISPRTFPSAMVSVS